MAKDPNRFADSGFFSPNKYKKNDKHPSHKGKITLSPKTLQRLNEFYKNGEEINLEFAGWRKDDDPSTVRLKVEEPYNKEGSTSRRRDEDDEPRSRGSVRREDPPRRRREEEDEDEYDRPKRARRDDDEDDFPGDRKRRSQHDDEWEERPKRRPRGDDYGDEGDL